MPRARGEKGGADLRRLPLIYFRKLGRQGVWGFSSHPQFSELTPLVPTIEIDPRAKGLKRMEIALHEALHIAAPALPEVTVRYSARYLAKVLWALGYRADDEEMEQNFPHVKNNS